MFVEIVHLFLTGKFLVASKGDNLHTRSHHEECHVKTYLVVTCTRRTMCYGIGTYLLGIACDGYSLEDAL